jgi:NADPH-dependent curcumin reductase CurA
MRIFGRRIVLSAVLLGLALLPTLGRTQEMVPAARAALPDATRSAGVLRVATSLQWPPFAYAADGGAPDGIDIYFENVGGAVWEAVLPLLNLFARVPVCGLVANYNASGLPQGPDRSQLMLQAVLNKSLTLRGFIQNEFAPTMFDDFLRDMGEWVREGKVRYREDITDGLEHAPEAFVGMLEGKNFGKTLVKVADLS